MFTGIYQVKSRNIWSVKLKFGILRLLLSLDRLVMQNNKTGRADEDNADGTKRRIKQAKGNKPFGIYLAEGGRFLRRTLGRCYDGLCVSAVVERLDENVVSKDNDRLGGEILRFIVESCRRRYASASPRAPYLFHSIQISES